MANCLPVYIVIDTSYSMRDHQDMLNSGIESLFDQIITSPRISDFAHISIISFNTDAEVILRMTDVKSMTALPQMECGGVTALGKALSLVRQRIEDDVPALTSSGLQVLRPVVFLLTDGQPTDSDGYQSDEWKDDYDKLVDEAYRRHPRIVPFGYGAATITTLNEIATKSPGVVFLAEDNSTADALSKVIPALLNTLVASARDDTLSIPAEVDGYIRVAKEIID